MVCTLPSFRPALESEIRSWIAYRQNLTPKGRPIFDQLMNLARAQSDTRVHNGVDYESNFNLKLNSAILG